MAKEVQKIFFKRKKHCTEVKFPQLEVQPLNFYSAKPEFYLSSDLAALRSDSPLLAWLLLIFIAQGRAVCPSVMICENGPGK